MRSRSADFLNAFKQLKCNHGYTKQEMLVLIKAYESYNSDVSSGKSQDDSGWLDAFYDIAPGIFHSPVQSIVIEDMRNKMPTYWEKNDETGRIRLAKDGIAYVAENPELVKSAQPLLAGVNHVRCG